jgi:hypothetical protein
LAAGTPLDILWSAPEGSLGNMVLGTAINEPLRFLRDCTGRPTFEGLARRSELVAIAGTGAETNEAAIRSSVAQVLNGRPLYERPDRAA